MLRTRKKRADHAVRHVHPTRVPLPSASCSTYVRSPARGKFLRKQSDSHETKRRVRPPSRVMSGGRWKKVAMVLRKLVRCPIYGKRELLVSWRTRAFRLIFCSSRLYNIVRSEPGIFSAENGRGGPKLSPHNSLMGSPKRASEIKPCNLKISPSALFRWPRLVHVAIS